MGFKVYPNDDIKPGDSYIAMRNTGLRLLTCKEVRSGFVVPTEPEYPYDLWECVKVEIK